jgi:hypothetical protein
MGVFRALVPTTLPCTLGAFYALLDCAVFGLTVRGSPAADLVRAATAVTEAVRGAGVVRWWWRAAVCCRAAGGGTRGRLVVSGWW